MMSLSIETTLYGISQLFQVPVLLCVVALFLYAFYALGGFLWQARQRRRGDPGGFDLIAAWRADRVRDAASLETLAFRRLETVRIASRVAPMLGLVATMIPMGPALKALSDGQLATVGGNLSVAFSAVILSLIAASLTYWVVNVRRRWYAEDLDAIETLRRQGDSAPEAPPAPVRMVVRGAAQ
jgi:biopolymer transport protein ExbB/TolQ